MKSRQKFTPHHHPTYYVNMVWYSFFHLLLTPTQIHTALGNVHALVRKQSCGVGLYIILGRLDWVNVQGREKCPGHSGHGLTEVFGLSYLLCSTHSRIMNNNLYQHAQDSPRGLASQLASPTKISSPRP